MKATVNRKALASALKQVTPAVAKGGSLPVLSGVRIEATAAGLDLCCSSIDLTAAVVVPDCTEVEPGVTIPPAALLSRIVDKLGGETVRLELAENVLTITSGETVATVRSFTPEEWPKIEYADTVVGTWSAHDLSLIERILPIAGTDGNRPMLTGVCLRADEAATTDSYHLGVVAGLPPMGETDVILPAAALRLAIAGEGEVEVAIGGRIATLTQANRSITTHLIEGEYPRYSGLIPENPPHHLTFARTELAFAVDRAQVTAIADTKSQARAIKLERDGDKARVWSDDADALAEVTDTIGCQGDYEGRLGFNPDYLAHLLDALEEDDEVELHVIDAMKPTTIHSGRLTLLIMPVRTT